VMGISLCLNEPPNNSFNPTRDSMAFKMLPFGED